MNIYVTGYKIYVIKRKYLFNIDLENLFGSIKFMSLIQSIQLIMFKFRLDNK